LYHYGFIIITVYLEPAPAMLVLDGVVFVIASFLRGGLSGYPFFLSPVLFELCACMDEQLGLMTIFTLTTF
jgi:hypothetical protein